MKYCVIQGYAQQRGMSARLAGKNEAGEKLYCLHSLDTGMCFTEPMTAEEFKKRRENGETFYKRFPQPSLMKLL